MFNRSKALMLGILTICTLTFVAGCDQPDDVITPNNRAFLTLTPERLPNNPVETVYELWVANDTDTLSLGRFGYEYVSGTFLNPTGGTRTDQGKFFLDESIDAYNSVIVSIEEATDPAINSPANVLLVDQLSNPTIKLVLPQSDSLWQSILRFNMKSTSDGKNSTINDGKSIWFSSYTLDNIIITDTLSITEWHLDSGNYINPDSVLIDTNVIGIDSIVTKDTIFVLGSDTLGVGLDTITRTIVRFHSIISIDTSDYFPTGLKITYTDSSYNVNEEKFTQDNFALPNLQRYGLHYKGWVVSDLIDSSAVGNITLPAWAFLDPILDEVSGGLLTTGIFYDINNSDLENPFLDTTFKNPPRMPSFPGEDFLLNLPAPLASIPNLAGSAGHVFVTIEPMFYDDTTNFPLFAFIGSLPPNGTQSIANQGFSITGYSYINDAFRGFPSIRVVVEKL